MKIRKKNEINNFCYIIRHSLYSINKVSRCYTKEQNRLSDKTYLEAD